MTNREAINEFKERITYIEKDGYANLAPEFIEAMNMAISALEKQEQEKWIPVTERLPEEDGSYWVCGRWGSGKIAVGDCEYSTEDGYFQTAWNFDVLAWMPLPEPYTEEESCTDFWGYGEDL